MPMLRSALAAIAALSFAPALLAAGDPPDWKKIYEDVKTGRVLPLRDIEQRIVPRMRGYDYLGPEYYDGTYRLKFMRSGSVVWLDVDGRTGQIIGRSGD